ncbi:MAG: radical SAM family heme chaperone HemW [Pseudomonadota bacterium]
MPFESSSPPASHEDWQEGGFGIYIHWPFCSAKCPYCDFNSHVVSSIDHDRWARAYLTEIACLASEVPGRPLRSVFFGGGTPSLMEPRTVGAILDAIAHNWPLQDDLEVTLEANPTSVEANKFRAFRQAGVNRLSLGVQALNDADLRALGRRHTAKEALDALSLARETFPRISFDLIYARAHQTLAEWEAELQQACAMAADHLSLYQLTIEPGTRFGELASRNRLRGLPEDDLATDLYEATQSVLEAHGLPAYEISNHARVGAECRHNLVYWRYGDYAGLGPGAHGRLTLQGERFSTYATASPADWLSQVELRGHGEAERERLDRSIQGEEMLIMGLRIAEGIDARRYKRLTGQSLDESATDRLISEGFLSHSNGRLRLTRAGRPVANSVINSLLIQ